jgi:hypothetical protein
VKQANLIAQTCRSSAPNLRYQIYAIATYWPSLPLNRPRRL